MGRRVADQAGATRVVWIVAALAGLLGLGAAIAVLWLDAAEPESAGRIEIVSLAVGGGSDDDAPEFLDLTVHNAGSRPATLSALRLTIQSFERLQICESGGPAVGWTEPEIELPAAPRNGDTVDGSMNHSVQPGQVDRFPITIGVQSAKADGTPRLYQVHVQLHVDALTAPLEAGEAIIAAPVEPIGSRFVMGGESAGGCKGANSTALVEFLSLSGARSPTLREPADVQDLPGLVPPPSVPVDGEIPTEPPPPLPSYSPPPTQLPGTPDDYEEVAISEGLSCEHFPQSVICLGQIRGESVITRITMLADDQVIGIATTVATPSDHVLPYVARLTRVAITSGEADEWIRSAPEQASEFGGVSREFDGYSGSVEIEFEGSWRFALDAQVDP
jgi:hypothetical protein